MLSGAIALSCFEDEGASCCCARQPEMRERAVRKKCASDFTTESESRSEPESQESSEIGREEDGSLRQGRSCR